MKSFKKGPKAKLNKFKSKRKQKIQINQYEFSLENKVVCENTKKNSRRVWYKTL